jgi:HK97 family phage major capsid protein
MPTPLLSTLTDSLVLDRRALDFTRWTQCVIEAGRSGSSSGAAVVELFEARYPGRTHDREVELVLKAAVAVGTTTGATWAAPLVGPMAEAFVTRLDERTVLGRLPGVQRVPFNTPVLLDLTGPTGAWVGEGKPKPLREGALDSTMVELAKAVDEFPITEELVRLTSPTVTRYLQAKLIQKMARFLDAQFLNPANAGVPGSAPPSITAGAPTMVASGTTPAAAAADLTALVSLFETATPEATTGVLTMSRGNLSAMAAGLGVEVSASAPSLLGYPVIVTNAVPDVVTILDPESILLADDGPTTITNSRHGTIEMNTTPTDPTGAATVLVSLWQHNLVAVRAERVINWQRPGDGGAATITGATYGAAAWMSTNARSSRLSSTSRRCSSTSAAYAKSAT